MARRLAILTAVMLAACGCRLQAQAIGSPSVSSGDRAMSAAVVASWLSSTSSDGRTALDLLVLWRGTLGWVFDQQPRGGGTRSSGSSVNTSIRYGDVTLELVFDRASRTVRVVGQTIPMSDNNVLLLDQVNSESPVVIGTKRVDPWLPEGRRVELVVRRSPELHEFMRCDARLEDRNRQAVAERLCAQIIPRGGDLGRGR